RAKTYLMKIRRSDKEKHEATCLALAQGWTMKTDETLTRAGKAVTTGPPAQEQTSILLDAKLMDNGGSAILNVYVKRLQDYLKQVEDGKVTDKATADRLYAGRNRLVKDMELWVSTEQLDKSLLDLGAIQETYKHPVKVMGFSELMGAAAQGT